MKKIFFKSNLENTKYQNTLSYERWHEIIQGQYLGKYIPLSNTDSDIADADIIYSLGLPIVSSKPDAVLAVILDNKKFHNSIQSVHRLTNGWGIILDKDNQVLFSSFPYHIELSSDFQKLTNNTGIIDRRIIITNIIEELAGQNNIGYVTEVDDTIACIINFRQTNSTEKKNDILRIADETVHYIKNEFYIECMISVSGIHESALGLQVAYQEALDVMEYKIVTENKKIIVYDDMNVSHNRYDYPIKTEQYLINSIKAGELEKAKEIVDEIFENNVSKVIPSIDMLRCLMFDLVSTMLKTLPEISFVSEESFLENLDVVNRLMGVKKISEFKKEILDILTEICGYVQKNKNDKNDDLINDVIEYIKVYYGDMNINVSTVAEKFSLTSSYLTKIFKEQTGEVLSNYITRIRLDESKKYLQVNDLSIKDIALKVGYYNSNIYIRAFKKYEGITPGAYRDLSK